MIRTVGRNLLILTGGLWAVVDAPVCGVDRHAVMHAVDRESMQKLDRRYKQRTWVLSNPKVWKTACGARATAAFGWPAVKGADSDGYAAAAWPPPVREIAADGNSRCRQCWEATGRRRPHSLWKSISYPEKVAA